jgi:IclR family acetate operon transcriptional repressor
VGKAILAHGPESLVQAVIDAGLPRISPRTVTAPGLLRRQLDRIRSEGIAYEREESGPGVVCAASPMLAGDDHAVAAISISGWSNRMRAERVAPAVRTAALALSRGLR